jgi:hypothetical protein
LARHCGRPSRSRRILGEVDGPLRRVVDAD